VCFWLLSCPLDGAGFATRLEPQSRHVALPTDRESTCACRPLCGAVAVVCDQLYGHYHIPECALDAVYAKLKDHCCAHHVMHASTQDALGAGAGGSALAAVGALPVRSDGGGGGEQRVAVGGGRRLVGYQPDRVRQPLHALLLRGLPRVRAVSAATPAAGALAALGSWSGARRIGGCVTDVPCAEAKGSALRSLGMLPDPARREGAGACSSPGSSLLPRPTMTAAGTDRARRRAAGVPARGRAP